MACWRHGYWSAEAMGPGQVLLESVLMAVADSAAETESSRAFLELDGDQSALLLADRCESASSLAPGPRVGLGLASRQTFKPPRSAVLDRAAAFLPQLAAANVVLSTCSDPGRFSAEKLEGNEREVIEMRLGLGVLEERSEGAEMTEASKRAEAGNEVEAEECSHHKEPSPMQPVSSLFRVNEDPFTRIVEQLLAFNSDDEVDMEGHDTCSSEESYASDTTADEEWSADSD